MRTAIPAPRINPGNLPGRTLVILLLLVGGSVGPLNAQAIDLPWRTFVWNDVFDSFDSSRFFLGANSSYDASARNMLLTPDAEGMAGRLVLKQQYDNRYYDVSFDAYFGTRSTVGRFGADGIVFMTALRYDYPTSGGSSLDFNGSGGYGVEFDDYYDTETNDPSEEHIGLIYQQTGNHLSSFVLPLLTLKNSAWHTITIKNRDGIFDVILDLVYRVTMPTLPYTASPAYFGFSASTGFSFNEQRIDNVSISVPSRLRIDIPDFSACDTTRDTLRFVLRNNHPERLPLDLLRLRLSELDGTGEFEILSTSVPLVLPAGDSTEIRVRFTGTGPGLRRAVLAVEAGNGEHVEDTLAIRGVMPVARWSTQGISFPIVRVGANAEQSVTLVNPGPFPFKIDTLRAAHPSFTVVSPAQFPVTLPPGDSIVVVIRFTPTAAGAVASRVGKGTGCGDLPELSLSGIGEVSTLRVRTQDAPVMLHPAEVTPVALALVDDPSRAAVRNLRLTLRYDASVVRLTGAWQEAGAFPDNSSFSWSEPAPGLVELRLQSPTDLVTAGTLCSLGFTPMTRDTGCSVLLSDTIIWNFAEAVPGIPYGAVEPARLCVNPSCRIPEGLRRKLLLNITNDPNPFTTVTHIRLDVPQDISANVSIVNARGELVHAYGFLSFSAGRHILDFEGADLPDGLYFLSVLSGSTETHHPIIRLR